MKKPDAEGTLENSIKLDAEGARPFLGLKLSGKRTEPAFSGHTLFAYFSELLNVR